LWNAGNSRSMGELIVPGKTGFLVDNITEAVEALKDIPSIDAKFCRQWAVDNFSLEKMVDDYIGVYKTVCRIG